jgi:hypothetical protein
MQNRVPVLSLMVGILSIPAISWLAGYFGWPPQDKYSAKFIVISILLALAIIAGFSILFRHIRVTPSKHKSALVFPMVLMLAAFIYLLKPSLELHLWFENNLIPVLSIILQHALLIPSIVLCFIALKRFFWSPQPSQ